MDLTKDVPRSPYESLAGIVFLPRAIDKARAEIAGTLGEYIALTGQSERVFELLDVSADEFVEAVRARATDAEMAVWAAERLASKSVEDLAAWNSWMMSRAPINAEQWARHNHYLEAMGKSDRLDIYRAFDRLDLDEGRDVPIGGRR